MNEQEQKAVLTVCLMAAFADGAKDERERSEIKRIAESLAGEGTVNLTALYQDVLFKRVTLQQVAAGLPSPEMRQFAFEMAVTVCDADGARNPVEADFLEQLRAALGLDAGAARSFQEQADALASVPPQASAAAYASTMSPAELDKMILNYSILNGALELLPQSLASMAIIPLQMKLVYRVGKAHGFELDRGHIGDFLATLGVGLTSQYVEQYGRKLIGGLLGKLAGGLGRGLGSAATGSAFSFASTYALGQVARTYYSGGRSLDTQRLKDTFAAMLGEAKGLQQRYAGEIEQKARTLDPNQILKMVREQ
jgi:uncharacterized protein (DUF697 family)/tellurite resistance protein